MSPHEHEPTPVDQVEVLRADQSIMELAQRSGFDQTVATACIGYIMQQPGTNVRPTEPDVLPLLDYLKKQYLASLSYETEGSDGISQTFTEAEATMLSAVLIPGRDEVAARPLFRAVSFVRERTSGRYVEIQLAQAFESGLAKVARPVPVSKRTSAPSKSHVSHDAVLDSKVVNKPERSKLGRSRTTAPWQDTHASNRKAVQSLRMESEGRPDDTEVVRSLCYEKGYSVQEVALMMGMDVTEINDILRHRTVAS